MPARPQEPRANRGELLVVDGFLSRKVCAAICHELVFAHWRSSTVFQAGWSASAIARERQSESTDESWFSAPLRRCIRRLDSRIASIVPHFKARRECWQATRYARGDRFEHHLDAGAWAAEPAGDRARTVLIFLDTPRAGGATDFPSLGMRIAPEAGRFVTWRNLGAGDQVDPEMIHASLPLRAGRKTVLVTWVRQRPFQRSAT